jgi:hypothetical protein
MGPFRGNSSHGAARRVGIVTRVAGPAESVPGSAPEPAAGVRTYLGWAVAVTCLCFLPLGIIAVVYSLRASSAVGRGDDAAATRAARVARRWIVATVVVWIGVFGVIAVALAMLGAFSAG